MTYEVYAFGSNGSGQLGIGHGDDVPLPTRCHFYPELSNWPSQVLAGGNHTLVLCADSTIYATGESYDGRCGDGASIEKTDTFRQVNFRGVDGNTIDRISLASATWASTCLVARRDIRNHSSTSKRPETTTKPQTAPRTGDLSDTVPRIQVYTCGTGSKGELGQGEAVIESKWPRLLPGFPPKDVDIIDLASCMSHTVAIFSNGEAWGWGNGRKGQLGEPPAVVWQPRKIQDIQFDACKVVCGRDFTVILGPSAAGSFKFLGTSKVHIESTLPNMLFPLCKVVAYWSGIHVVTENGKILSSGRNDFGQLAPSTLPAMTALIAAGSEHTVAQTTSGDVIAWGWGEHGNCGTRPESNESAIGLWNTIPHSGGVLAVGAGCATSFLIIQQP